MAKRPEVIAYPAPALPSGGGYTGEWGGGEVLGSPPVAVPETVADYFMLGTTALQEGRNGDAIEAFERAVEIDPDFPEAWNHLAICYQNNGQEARAIEAFRRYKAIAAR
jgi:tetratricopeptide (TPR) repeat protein